MTTVLLVEDDPAISEPLARAFGREGYEVRAHGTGKGALEEVAGADIIVLDLGLPDMDGLDVARQVRVQGLTIPILMLTARSEDTDLVVGLDAGADDYVTKPFRLAELLARVRAQVRRASGEAIEFSRRSGGRTRRVRSRLSRCMSHGCAASSVTTPIPPHCSCGMATGIAWWSNCADECIDNCVAA